MLNFVIVFVVSTCIAYIGYYQWTRRKIRATFAKMNGPVSLPLIGNSYRLVKWTSQESIWRGMVELANSYESPVGLNLGPVMHVLLYKPEHLQVVMNSPYCLNKAFQYSFLRVEKGIFAAPAHVWKDQRRILNPTFGPVVVNSFIPIFNQKCTIFVDVLKENYANRGPVDVLNALSKCTLDLICSTAFGLDFDLQRSADGDHFLSRQEEYVDIFIDRLVKPWFYPEFIYRLTKGYKRSMEILEESKDRMKRVMDERNLNQNNNDAESLNEVSQDSYVKKPQIFLDKLLELAQKNKELTDEHINQHLDTMVFAGNDTTAATMCSLLLMLAMHPDVQERVYQEIVQACPDKDKEVTMGEISHLPYTEMVCKETMRLFPVGPVIGRTSTADIKLDDNYTIPANTALTMCIYMVHRNKEIWGADADQFNPDHFLPEQVSKRHPYSFVPFSGGARNCIGIKYAWVAMKIMLVYVLRRYRLKTPLTMDTLKIKYTIVLKMVSGCLLSLEERQ
ncbi:cytochrome P450 4C1-like [Uranotaenia lowii]|uniref:cytochrome P450 4C1-like n=1 Tax=Uranotaenia lowii TaxID=190385 RepID=UPI00247900C4|nr:cytochrome P450 4C1-like [Uranotaenia lowii]